MASISSIITFVPTIGENDKKPESEKFLVKLKAVNVQKKQNQLRKFIETDPKQLMKSMMDPRQQDEIKSMLTEHFVKFINFDVTDIATKKDAEESKQGQVFGQLQVLKEGDEYLRPATIEDIFNLGEFELAMEIFMYLIGSSQLRRAPVTPTLTAGQDREDEEKNSESPSGTSLTTVQ